MNALEAASLVMIPSGYEDGTLGSLKPTDGTGDFTFTRGSNISATRVNADGYIEKGYENRLLQSNQFDTTWITSGTLTSGQSGYDSSSDAWLFESPSTFMNIGQSVSQSNVQTFSVYVKAGTTDWVQLRLLGSSTIYATFDLNPSTTGSRIGLKSLEIDASIKDVGNGWFRCSLVGNNSTTTARIYIARNNSTTINVGDNIYIQDAMLNQGLVAYPYVETTTAPVAGGILEDMPRLDYSNGSCPSLLLEPSRTNLLKNSEALNISPNVIESVSYSYNEIASPSGFINAPKFSETPDLTSYRHGFYHYVSIPNGAITASIFTKQIDRRYVSFQSNATGSNQYSYADLQDGSVVSEGTGWTLSTEDYGNGWWRIIATATGIQGSPYFIWGMSLNGTSNTYSGDGSEFTFWGGQIEAGSYPTSYIPTYGVSQTRLADDAVAYSLGSIAGQSEGTLFAYFETIGDSGTPYISLNQNNGVVNRVLIYNNNGVSAEVRSGGSPQSSITSTTQGLVKAAIAYKENDFAFYINGSQIGTDTSGSTFGAGVLNELNLGYANQDGAEIKQVVLFDTRLSNTDLATLTTL